MLYLSAGVLVGFGLSGCSFNLVISSFAKLVPDSWRSMAFGAGTAAGSFGQFLFSPLGVGLIDAYRLADRARDFRRPSAADHSAGARGGDAAARRRRARAGRRRAGDPDLPAGAGRGARAPLLRAAGARLLHLRLPARLRHRAPAVLPDRPRPLGRGRRLDARPHRPVQHHRRDDLGLARRPHAQALHPLVHLFQPRARRGRASSRCRRARPWR